MNEHEPLVIEDEPGDFGFHTVHEIIEGDPMLRQSSAEDKATFFDGLERIKETVWGPSIPKAITAGTARDVVQRPPRQEPELNRDHPVVQALLSMNRVQRRAFGAELRRLNRGKNAKKDPGLKSAWQAAQARGWRGTIPVGPAALGMAAEKIAGAGPAAR